MEQTELLIQEIQRKPILWDRRLKDYHNHELTDREWDEIAEKTGIRKEIAKKKWKGLRDHYRKNLRVENPKWLHFESLHFLRKTITPTSKDVKNDKDNDISYSQFINCLNNDENISEAKLGDEEEDPENESPAEDDNVNDYCQTIIKPSNTRKRKLVNSLTPYQSKMIAIEKAKLKCMEKEFTIDDDLYFFKSLVPYMKKINHIKRLELREKILQLVVSESKFNEYEENKSI